jgi:hypothetical protein
VIERNGGDDGARTRLGSPQPVSGRCKSFHLNTGCGRRCSLSQPVLAGCYQDVITGILPSALNPRRRTRSINSTEARVFVQRPNLKHTYADTEHELRSVAKWYRQDTGQ